MVKCCLVHLLAQGGVITLLKLLAVVLLISMIASLFTGFYFLVSDQGNRRLRLMYALGIRVSLALLFIGVMAYGIASGQFASQAPWDRSLHPERVQAEPRD